MINLENDDGFRVAVDKMVYWSKLFGVLSYIAGALMIAGGIALLSSAGGNYSGVDGVQSVVLIIMSAFYFIPGCYLNNLSKTTRQALNTDDMEKLAEGFVPMGRLFKFFGVLTVIVLSLYGMALFSELI